MKKQIGLIALTALLVSFVACSGVASAQASNVQVVFFTSPLCSVCQQVHPLVESAAAKYGVNLIVYDVSTTEGKGIAQANSVSSTPTIVISGAQPARFEGAVTQAQIEAAIKAAIGTATPTATPIATTTPKATTTVKQAATTPKATTTVKATKTVAKTVAQPSIEVVKTTQTPTTSTQTVPEFSLLGLGAPALVVGAIYLFLRRR
ncbi:MAG: thioredoxin family protein [Halobacteriota archaeon]